MILFALNHCSIDYPHIAYLAMIYMCDIVALFNNTFPIYII